MSKAILVMDMPNSCDKCLLFGSHYSDMTCRVNGKSINYPYPKEERQEWCPLKPMPEHKEEHHTSEYEDIKNEGFNACLDMILNT